MKHNTLEKKMRKTFSNTDHWVEKLKQTDTEWMQWSWGQGLWWEAHSSSEVKGAGIRGETFSLC